jgi:tetratricopeptide (TPR) repeat protein
MKKGDFLDAARLAESQYLEGNPNNPFWLTRRAAALSRAGQCEMAYEIGRQALSLQPSNPYSILAVAEALFGLNRIEEALEYYREIAGDAKVADFAQKGALESLDRLGRWNEILAAIAQWGIAEDLSIRWKIKALSGLDRLDEALDQCNRWLERDPDNVTALWELTELEIRKDGLEAVMTKMGRIAKIPSRPPIYKEIYASLCRRAGKPELALKQYEKLASGVSDARIHRQQAFTLAKNGRELEAIPIFEEQMRQKPGDFYVHSAYISACTRVNELDRALAFYQDLAERYPEEKGLYGRIRKVQAAKRKENTGD